MLPAAQSWFDFYPLKFQDSLIALRLHFHIEPEKTIFGQPGGQILCRTDQNGIARHQATVAQAILLVGN